MQNISKSDMYEISKPVFGDPYSFMIFPKDVLPMKNILIGLKTD